MFEINKKSLETFQHFIANLKDQSNFLRISVLQQKYNIQEFKLLDLKIYVAHSIYKELQAKFGTEANKKQEMSWFENELRIFTWVVMHYIGVYKNSELENMMDRDWQFILKMFPNKKIDLFEYQSMIYLKKHKQFKRWSSEEDQVFTHVIQYFPSNARLNQNKMKWSLLAKRLYHFSNKKYFRTPKQCRQRWLNHLDPMKLKHSWTKKEDLILIKTVEEFGKKWSLIARRLNGKRNQHSIKNRYKSLLTKQRKSQEVQLIESELVHSLKTKLSQVQSASEAQHQSDEMSSQEHVQSSLSIQVGDQFKQNNQLVNSELAPSIQLYQSFKLTLNYDEQAENASILRNKEVQNQITNKQHTFEPVESQCSIHYRDLQFMDSQPPHSNIFQIKSSHLLRPNMMFAQNSLECLEREKQIRADILLQNDPFETLKRHFGKYRQIE